jgi:PGF-CTERM protein
MQSSTFTIYPATSTNQGVGTGVLSALNGGSTAVFVWNRDISTTATTSANIFQIAGNGALQGSDAAEALVSALNDPNVPDTYTKLQFTVAVPYINVEPVGDHAVGDKFTVTGDTNLAVGDNVLVQIYSSSFQPTQKTQSGEFSGATGTVQVVAGTTGANQATFSVDTSTFKPDEYIVEMDGVTQTATGTALFNVLQAAPPTAAPTAAVTTAAAPTVVPTTVMTVPPTTVAPTPVPTTKSPGFGALIALIGLGAVAFIVVRRH